jgi:RNA polymerase sigma-70 factor (ECF subfamily)
MNAIVNPPRMVETPAVSPSQHYAAVSACIVEFLPKLQAFSRSVTRNRDLADDLVQEAILRALTAAEQFTLGTNFRAWIFVILRNLLYNETRKPWSRLVSLDDLDGYEPSVRADQDQNLEFCDFRRAFRQLCKDQQEVLALVGVSGMSYQEAAASCDCPIGTVKSRVSRARRDLKIFLTDDKLGHRRNMVAPLAGSDLMSALNDHHC